MPIDPEDYRRRLTASGVPDFLLDEALETALEAEAARDAAAFLARVVAHAPGRDGRGRLSN